MNCLREFDEFFEENILSFHMSESQRKDYTLYANENKRQMNGKYRARISFVCIITY